MQVELLETRRWKTRVELANAIFEYLEIFHNRRRRHSALGRTPIECELLNTQQVAARVKESAPPNQGTARSPSKPVWLLLLRGSTQREAPRPSIH
jgi:hypothetical protein